MGKNREKKPNGELELNLALKIAKDTSSPFYYPDIDEILEILSDAEKTIFQPLHTENETNFRLHLAEIINEIIKNRLDVGKVCKYIKLLKTVRTFGIDLDDVKTSSQLIDEMEKRKIEVKDLIKKVRTEFGSNSSKKIKKKKELNSL